MRTILLLFLFLYNILLFGQSSGQNYLQVIKPKEAFTIADYENLSFRPSVGNSIRDISYRDGLGRNFQTIRVLGTQDIVKYVEYDQFGKVSKNYMPFTTETFSDFIFFNNGAALSNPKSTQSTYYSSVYDDNTPYSETIYDGSPLGRITEMSAGGDVWKKVPNSTVGKTKKYTYGVNAAAEIRINSVSESTIIDNTMYYPAGSLIKLVVKNENWKISDGDINTVHTFTDKSGNKIADIAFYKEGNIVKKLLTEYVYDNKGLLRYVLSPKAASFDYQSLNTPRSRKFTIGKIVTSLNGAGTVDVAVNNGTLTLNISGNFAPTTLRTGPVAYIDERFADITIGTLNCTACGSNYTLSIKDGYLFISAVNPNVTTTSVSATLNAYVGALSLITNQQFLDKYAYQYQYDGYNRKVEQKSPGVGWEYVVFDNQDRPILTQNANLKAKGEWLYTKYDVYGRVIYTGVYKSGMGRTDLQQVANDFFVSNLNNYEKRTVSGSLLPGNVNLFYDRSAFPVTGSVLKIYYYDDYNFNNVILPPIPEVVQGQAVTKNTQGLLTLSYISNLPTDTGWTATITSYDEEARQIYVCQTNHLGGYTITETKFDFNGKIEKSVTRHKRSSRLLIPEIVVTNRLTYDGNEQLIGKYQTINNQPEETLATYLYDGLGNVIQKNVGGRTSLALPLQKVNYSYNIRGWLTDINKFNALDSDLFAYKIEHAVSSDLSPSNYNGNISRIYWKNNINGVTSPVCGYHYIYDDLNRLSNSLYVGSTSSGINANNMFNESISYDLNGNIETLKRNGADEESVIPIDDLSYDYDGNRLMRVNDNKGSQGFNDGSTSGSSLVDYTYDDNGNLTADRNKNILKVTYNILNLPEVVTFVSGAKIQFTYNAFGDKISKLYTPIAGNAILTEYFSGFQYQNSILLHFPTTEGYVIRSLSGSNEVFTYIYNYIDHLGNIRLSYKGDTVISYEERFDTDTGGFSAVGNATVTNFSGGLVTSLPSNVSSLSGCQRLIGTNVVSGTKITITGKLTTGRIGFALTGPQAIIVRYNTNGTVVEEVLSTSTLGNFSYEYFVPTSSTAIYLKFVRTTTTATASFTIDDFIVYKTDLQTMSASNYYPYGLAHFGEIVNSGSSTYNYKFQGKELQTELDFGYYDFGSRLYEPSVGRWFTPDPMNQFVSPYLAMSNNPIMSVDPNGEWAVWDDIGAMLVGGAVNVVGNIDNIKSLEDGFYYFGVGALAGEATLYGGPAAGGLVLGAGNNLIQQLSDPNKDFDVYEMTASGIIGAGTGAVSAWIGPTITGPINKLFNNVSNQLARQFLTDATVSVSSGVLIGYGTAKAFGTEFDLWSNVRSSLITSSVSFGVQHITSQTKGYYQGKREQEALAAKQENSRGNSNNQSSSENNKGRDYIDLSEFEGTQMVRVRHHTDKNHMDVIKSEMAIRNSRGYDSWDVHVEVEPFIRPSQTKLGNLNKGSYVEFSVPSASLTSNRFINGPGDGNAAYIRSQGTFSQYLDITNRQPTFKNWAGGWRSLFY